MNSDCKKINVERHTFEKIVVFVISGTHCGVGEETEAC